VVALTVVRVHGLGAVKVPPVLGATLKRTLPPGVDEPRPATSLTDAVQLVGCPTVGLAGVQTTVVDVVRRVPVTEPLVAPLLALPACTASLAVYVPVMVAVPAALGVNVTEHVPAADSVQLGALNVPARPVAVKPTEPPGVVAPAPLVSATVAVQVEA
jgi:hypothetical protein